MTQSRILNFFNRSVNFSTCILALAIPLVSITSSFCECVPFPKKGRINVVACFVSKRCCIVSPTSKALPGFICYNIPHWSNISTWLMLLSNKSDIKRAASFGFTAIKHFIVQWLLYDS